MPSKPTKRRPQLGTKAAFIAEHAALSAVEIVALAKKNGMSLSPAYVHTLKSSLRKKIAGAKTSSKTSAPRAPRGTWSEPGDKVTQLARLIVQVGLDVARPVLERLEAQSI